MKPYKFIILYGLPGAGKTTLATRFAANNKVKYIRLDVIPGFEKNTINVIRDQFDSNTHVITEGCFPSHKFRFSVTRKTPETHFPMCVYIHEDLSTLSQRRNRTIEEYRKLLDKMQILDDPPHHVVLRAKDVDTRVAILEDLLSVDLTDYPLPQMTSSDNR